MKQTEARRLSSRQTTDLLALLAVAVAVAVVLIVAGVGSGMERRPLVYVSGLDDHLLPATTQIPVHDTAGGTVTGQIPAGTVVWVHGEQGEWLEVETGEGTPRRGWVADFYLRGELHVVDPDAPGCPVPTTHEPEEAVHHQLEASTRIELLDLHEGSSGLWVQVRSLQTEASSWVRRETLSERPGPNPATSPAGTPCGDLLPEPAVPHNH